MPINQRTDIGFELGIGHASQRVHRATFHPARMILGITPGRPGRHQEHTRRSRKDQREPDNVGDAQQFAGDQHVETTPTTGIPSAPSEAVAAGNRRTISNHIA